MIGVVFLHYFATNGRSTFCAFQHLLTNILSTPAFLNAEWVMLYMNSASPPFVFVFVSVLYFFFLQKLSRTRSAPAQSKLLKLDSAWEAANGKMELDVHWLTKDICEKMYWVRIYPCLKGTLPQKVMDWKGYQWHSAQAFPDCTVRRPLLLHWLENPWLSLCSEKK